MRNNNLCTKVSCQTLFTSGIFIEVERDFVRLGSSLAMASKDVAACTLKPISNILTTCCTSNVVVVSPPSRIIQLTKSTAI